MFSRFSLTFLLVIISVAVSAVAQERYVLPCRSDLFYKFVEVRESQLGVREKTGRNDGEVTKYWKDLGYKGSGFSYCNFGLVWSWHLAAKMLGIDTAFIPVPNSGLARSSYTFAKKYGTRTNYSVYFGDNLVYKYGTWQGHVESVDSVLKNGWVYTVGFNTSGNASGSQSNGNGVHRKKRNYLMPTERMKMLGLVGFELVEVTAENANTENLNYLINIQIQKYRSLISINK